MTWWMIVLLAWLAPGMLVSLALLWCGWLKPMLQRVGALAVARPEPAGPAEAGIQVRSPGARFVLRFRGLRRSQVRKLATAHSETREFEPPAALPVEEGKAAHQPIIIEDAPLMAPIPVLAAEDCAAACSA